MGAPKVTIDLTEDQVADVILAARDSGHGPPVPLLSWLDPIALASSNLIRDPKLCRSLIIGFAVFLSFHPTREPRGTKEVAEELGLGTSTGHRYVQTLERIGLLTQDPATRHYRRAHQPKSNLSGDQQ